MCVCVCVGAGDGEERALKPEATELPEPEWSFQLNYSNACNICMPVSEQKQYEKNVLLHVKMCCLDLCA